ncbi:MAG: thiamine pyrophosphate-dependent enzyme [Edaphobacter sp.]
MSETAPHENPLVPNKKLRQIYTAMVHARLLDEHMAKLQRKTKVRRLTSTRGEEACRVATAIEMKQGDLVSDAQRSATMDLLFGATLTPLLRNIAAVISGSQTRDRISTNAGIVSRQLPWIDGAEHRIHMAMGAALALKTQQQNNIVMAYAYQAELPKRAWKQVLTLATHLNLPIIFVLLPQANGNGEATNICKDARTAGLPGIPVDASDAVALYRVAQESMGRSRGGDGPVLIECISCRAIGQRKDKMSDPILHMKDFLTGRKICKEDWANHAREAFLKKLTIANR